MDNHKSHSNAQKTVLALQTFYLQTLYPSQHIPTVIEVLSAKIETQLLLGAPLC